MTTALKIEVPTKSLKDALSVVAIGLDSGDDDKLGAHYVVRVKDSQVMILSSTAAIFASSELKDAKVNQPEAMFTIPGWRLQKWAQTVTDETLTIEHANAVTRLISSKGSGKVSSLDPSGFNFWDQTLAATTETATVDAKLLFQALDTVKKFASVQDTSTPQLCAVECQHSALWGMGNAAVSFVAVPGMEKAAIRIFSKHVSAINSFLSFAGNRADGKVVILEHAKCQIFRQGGNLVGVSRWQHAFPAQIVQKAKLQCEGKPKATFTLKVKALKEAITYLSTFANKSDMSVYFLPEDNSVDVSITSAANTAERDAVTVPTTSVMGLEQLIASNRAEFKLETDIVDKVLSGYDPEDDLTLDLFLSVKSGYCVVRRNKSVDSTFMLQWSK